MNAILVTAPAYGHLHPLIPLGTALEARGHKVFVATTDNFMPAVTSTGLRSLPLGQAEDMGPGRAINRPASIDALVAQAREIQADVIIHDHLAAGAGLAAELLGIPNAYLSVGIMRPPPIMNHVRQNLCAPLWAHYGRPLPPDLGLYRYLYLDRCPPSLQPPQIHDIATTHPISPLNYDGAEDGGLPDWMADLGSRPVIYVTLGTMFNSIQAFSNILSALDGEDAEVIVTVGRDLDPAAFGPQPANVHIERYIPQSLLLPRCDLVISHGGSGTMMASLAVGLPLVILPQSLVTDQSWNGERCAARGAGLMLMPEEATPQAIREAVRAVRGESAYRRNAQEVAAEIAALPGLDHAVDLIETLVASRNEVRQPQTGVSLRLTRQSHHS